MSVTLSSVVKFVDSKMRRDAAGFYICHGLQRYEKLVSTLQGHSFGFITETRSDAPVLCVFNITVKSVLVALHIVFPVHRSSAKPCICSGFEKSDYCLKV